MNHLFILCEFDSFIVYAKLKLQVARFHSLFLCFQSYESWTTIQQLDQYTIFVWFSLSISDEEMADNNKFLFTVKKVGLGSELRINWIRTGNNILFNIWMTENDCESSFNRIKSPLDGRHYTNITEIERNFEFQFDWIKHVLDIRRPLNRKFNLTPVSREFIQ